MREDTISDMVGEKLHGTREGRRAHVGVAAIFPREKRVCRSLLAYLKNFVCSSVQYPGIVILLAALTRAVR